MDLEIIPRLLFLAIILVIVLVLFTKQKIIFEEKNCEKMKENILLGVRYGKGIVKNDFLGFKWDIEMNPPTLNQIREYYKERCI